MSRDEAKRISPNQSNCKDSKVTIQETSYSIFGTDQADRLIKIYKPTQNRATGKKRRYLGDKPREQKVIVVVFDEGVTRSFSLPLLIEKLLDRSAQNLHILTRLHSQTLSSPKLQAPSSNLAAAPNRVSCFIVWGMLVVFVTQSWTRDIYWRLLGILTPPPTFFFYITQVTVGGKNILTKIPNRAK